MKETRVRPTACFVVGGADTMIGDEKAIAFEVSMAILFALGSPALRPRDLVLLR